MADNSRSGNQAEESLPSYDEVEKNQDRGAQDRTEDHRPTVTSPFDFPDAPAPPYSESNSVQRPIAIPQIRPDAAAPFVEGYARSLLGYGITPETWRSFVATTSAFLAAKVSEQAVSHAAEIAREVGNIPKQFGRDTAGHAKSIASHIKNTAKQGNYIGAAVGSVGGLVSLSVGTALRATGAAVSMPFRTASAVAIHPKTPLERAAAYTAVANAEWLLSRGLQVELLETSGLAERVGVSVDQILNATRGLKSTSAGEQLNALRDVISPLEVWNSISLELGSKTLWLVATRSDQRL